MLCGYRADHYFSAQLLVFFLPLLIGLLHIFGLSNRLPQRAIHPETGKISQGTIEEQTRLVYYTPAREEEEVGVSNSRNSLEELERLGDQLPNKDHRIQQAMSIPLPLSRAVSTHSNIHGNVTSTDANLTLAQQSAPTPRRKRLGLLFRMQKKRKGGDDLGKGNESILMGDTQTERSGRTKERSKYPLFPVSASHIQRRQAMALTDPVLDSVLFSYLPTEQAVQFAFVTLKS